MSPCGSGRGSEVLALRVTPASWHDSPVGRGMPWGVEVVPGEKPPVVVADAAYEGAVHLGKGPQRGLGDGLELGGPASWAGGSAHYPGVTCGGVRWACG